ncbi:MAG: YdeI/OmpD-associated family protein [Actinomycetota bacterium]
MTATPMFFATPARFRAWLRKNHKTADELVVGFYKKASGIPSITWPEAVDEALCFGWIDGVRRRIDEKSYSNRFTPRRKGSNWSAINVKRVEELTELGRVSPAGIKAFEAREDDRTAIYSYEQRTSAAFDADQEKRFRRSAKAWTFFQKQAPWYRRAATYWVVSAKRADTREKRLAALIRDSAAGRRVPPLTPPEKR